MAKRKRLWVPGKAFVESSGRVTTGRQVGFSETSADFRLCPVGGQTSLRDCVHTVWLVSRKSLTDTLVEEQALIQAERLVDAEAQPSLHRWLSEQPLVAISASKWDGLIEGGCRLFRVSYGVRSEGWLEVEAAGAGRGGWTFSGPTAAMLPPSIDESPLPIEERWEWRALLDRLLRQVTRGELTEASVVNALFARVLVEPGYGYHGSEFGKLASVAGVQKRARGTDALFKQVFARAETQRSAAEEVAAVLNRATTDPTEFAAPGLGPVRPKRLEGYTISTDLSKGDDGIGVTFAVDDKPDATFDVDPFVVWLTEPFSSKWPRLDDALREELASTGGTGKAKVTTNAAIVVLLVLAIVVGVLVSQVR